MQKVHRITNLYSSEMNSTHLKFAIGRVMLTKEHLLKHAISSDQVSIKGHLTEPRSYGVYALPLDRDGTKRFRFGNHPVRQQELKHEFGSCTLYQLFLERKDAEKLAKWLNKEIQ